VIAVRYYDISLNLSPDTVGTNRAAQVLAALGITDLDPPTPPREAATVA
jgi:hypothetical protein